MGLVGAPSSPRLVVTRTGEDKTAAMRAFSRGRVEALVALGLDGYVLKSKSPSCGMAGVPVGRRWLDEVKRYEREVLANRG